MSKFAYLAEGELNSNYLYELLNEYLDDVIELNDTKGIVEDVFKIDVSASNFKRGFNDFKNRLHIRLKNKSALENYNKLLSFNYAKNIKNRLKIYQTSNMLEAKDLFEIIQISKTIGFDRIIPEIEENRNKAIRKCNKNVLKALDDIKYLKNAETDRVLFDSPVSDIKPFLSDKVSNHLVQIEELSQIVKKFVAERDAELYKLDFEEYIPDFENNLEDFYHTQITSDGIGEDVEDFIRNKMLQKLAISKQDDTLIEDRLSQIAMVDALLKRLGIAKIEKLMQKLIKMNCNRAQAKEGIERCKKLLDKSTIENKENIFLAMDSILYKLEDKCKKLAETVKLKLQLVDKERLFDLARSIAEEDENKKIKKASQVEDKHEEKDEIHISVGEDNAIDLSNDEEFIIDENDDN